MSTIRFRVQECVKEFKYFSQLGSNGFSQKPSELVKGGEQCYNSALDENRMCVLPTQSKGRDGSLHFSCKWMIVPLELICYFRVSFRFFSLELKEVSAGAGPEPWSEVSFQPLDLPRIVHKMFPVYLV